MVMCEFTISPLGKGESVSTYVARVLHVIDSSGIPYILTPMSTIVEGTWDEVMGVVGACYKELEKDCTRISVSVKIDARAGAASRLASKIDKVESIVGKKLTAVQQASA